MRRKAVDITAKRTIILLRAIATKPGAGRRSKLTDRQKRAIKLQQVRDDTLSLNDLIRYVQTSFNITVSRRTNRIYIRRFRNDLKRFERSQPRVHKGGGVGIWSYLTCHGLGPIVFYDGSLNSDKYIDILDQHLPTAYEKFLPQSPRKILLQQDNARPHVSIKTRKYFKKKKINPIPWPANSADLNLIENIWSILDDKLLKYNINNTDQLKTALKMAWMEISHDTI
ncbi:unnamed protein product [Rotaria socialis]